VVSTTYSISIFVKDGATAPFLRVRIGTAAGSVSTWFDLANYAAGSVAVGASLARVETLAATGWKRYSFSYLPAAGDEGSRSIVFAGVSANGGAVASGALTVWGAQVEASALVTSYMGVTAGSTVTRAVDNCTVPVSAIAGFSSTAGTLFAEGSAPNLLASGAQYLAAIGTGGSNESRLRYVNALAATQIHETGAGETFAFTLAASPSTLYRLSVGYDAVGAIGVINGTLSAADTTVTLPGSPTRLALGQSAGGVGGSCLDGWLRRVTYYNTRLENAPLNRIAS
jgi:hypothetical protein